MRVFVAGASGVVGRPLCRTLCRAGHDVVALTRSAASGESLRELGAQPVIADIFDEKSVVAVVAAARPEAVIHQLTAIPARTNPRRADVDFAATNRLRTEGTRILLEAASRAGARRFIAQSISFVLAPEGASPAAEEPVWPGEKGFSGLNGAVQELETVVTGATELIGIALRYGAFYGPGTVFAKGGSFHEDVARRKIPVVGAGGGVFSFVHVEDAAGAAVSALSRGERGVYNVVDDEPASVAEWLPYYAGCIGAPAPRRVPAWLASPLLGAYGLYLLTKQRAVSNAKARRELGWSPTISSWRTGFRERLER
jgi:nucleoside-diphosphate-sugar epimerase